jgi:hypothetical protein
MPLRKQIALSGFTLVNLLTSRGRDTHLLRKQLQKHKKVKKPIKKQNEDNEEEETSNGEEELVEDVNKDIIEELLKKRA